MSQFYDLASLVVIPSGYKASTIYAQKPLTTDGQLSFTRASGATRVGPNGLIEEVRTNFARQSQSFATASAWATTNGTLTNNAGIAPDGTNTASKLVATNTDPFAYQSITLTGPVVASCYFKGVGSSIGKTSELRIGAAVTTFTLTANWQRISVTSTVAGAANYGVEAPNLSVVVGDEVLLWGFQVEQGDIATDYIPTTTAAVSVGPVSNLPRLDYTNSSCPRLLLEPQRTNLALWSEQFNNANWIKSASGTGVAPAVTANNAVSPDGYTSADTVVFNAGAGTTASDFSLLSESFASTTATHTASFYAKVASGTAQLLWRIDGAGYEKITITNQWQRFTLTKALTGASNSFELTIRRGLSEPLNASATVQLWGVQVEAGSYATSYIPTLSASVTRVADAASKTGISSLLSASEYTLFWEGTHIPTGQYNSFMTIYNAANNAFSARFYRNNTNNEVRATMFNPSTSFSLDMGSGITASYIKCALRVKAGNYAFYVNGSLVNSSTNALAPSNILDSVNLQFYGSSQSFDQNTAQALFFKTGLTNAQMAELTTL